MAGKYIINVLEPFQPTCPLRGATKLNDTVTQPWEISIHAPLAGRDHPRSLHSPRRSDFNPRAPCGARPVSLPARRRHANFNPRAPCGARRSCRILWMPVFSYFNPRAPCGARHLIEPIIGTRLDFNPRAPCGARPHTHGQEGYQSGAISIHAPLAGRDEEYLDFLITQQDFNPRAPCGARPATLRRRRRSTDFNPRAPCGARPHTHGQEGYQSGAISIHAPLAGRDEEYLDFLITQQDFNPRAPCGARPATLRRRRRSTDFNPRAPCGARHDRVILVHQQDDFNPRAPCGARPLLRFIPQPFPIFQSTRPLRGATLRRQGVRLLLGISIHAPLAGRDCSADTGAAAPATFQSTRPLRGATAKTHKNLPAFLR